MSASSLYASLTLRKIKTKLKNYVHISHSIVLKIYVKDICFLIPENA